MPSKWIKSYAAAGALLLLIGCNLYNPGGGDADEAASCDQSDVNCLMKSGLNLHRKHQYAAAMSAYSKVLSLDSNVTMAYYGYAKAAVRFYNADNFGVLKDLDSTNGDTTGTLFFLNHDDAVLTRRLQAAYHVNFMLKLLTDRDTLTQLKVKLDRRGTAKGIQDSLNDTAYTRRMDFMAGYLAKADADSAGYRKRARFPLVDNFKSSSDVALQFTTSQLLFTMTSLYDLDGNHIIDSNDNLLKKLNFGGKNGFSIDSLSKIQGDLENDTTGALSTNLNSMILNTSGNLEATLSLIGLIAPPKKANDTGGTSQNTQQNLDSVVKSLGDAVAFYQFGDNKDNDGDGCIDEEIMDEKDNDGDGYVDEDARVTMHPLFEIADNDRNGYVNDSGFINGITKVVLENPIGEANVTVGQPNPAILGFIHNFYTTYPDSIGNFVKIHKGDSLLSFRIRLQKDSLATKTAAQLRGAFKPKLDSAKALIGGCWRNYPGNLDTPPNPGAAKRSKR